MSKITTAAAILLTAGSIGLAAQSAPKPNTTPSQPKAAAAQTNRSSTDKTATPKAKKHRRHHHKKHTARTSPATTSPAKSPAGTTSTAPKK
jgi:hypothetical protein